MKSAKSDAYLYFGWFPLPETEEIAIENAPVFLQGLNVLFVSDIHLRKCVPDEKLRALINLIRAQNADLILFGGDYAETADQHARFFEALSGVQAKYGIYGVMGNNDREAFPDTDVFRRLAARGGMRLLVNEFETIDAGGYLQIGGCDDHKWGKPCTKDLFSGNDYRILLSHFPVKPDCHADLMLSGHTHGGQFNILGITPYTVGFEFGYHMEAVSGLHKFSNRQLLVSKGIGASRIQLRVGVAPEINLVTFSADDPIVQVN
jgi:predicted MPP superfamily phosphohydrolase